MKKLALFSIGFLIFYSGFSQIISEIDQFSPFHEELAAIRKGNSWAFIDQEGTIVIDYREDLVRSNPKNKEPDFKNAIPENYPFFTNDRCLVKKNVEGIDYYGYIDKEGNIIVDPEYVNATNFEEGYALVIKFSKRIIGKNNLLGKDVVSHQIEDYVINRKGEIVLSLMNPKNYVVNTDKAKVPPSFRSKFISPHLVACKNENQDWLIYKF